MATIQIRDIPEDVYEVIRRRARADGKSIQAYMRDHVVGFAHRRSKREVFEEIRAAWEADPRPGFTTEDILDDLAADRR